MTAPLVDSHVHLFTADLPLAARACTRPATALPVDELLPLMDGTGVTHAVVSAMSLLGDPNAYTLAALQAHPERLRATVAVEPGVPRAELERMRAAGVVGIRWQLRRTERLPDPTEPEVRDLLRAVADLGWHVELNVEHERLAPLLDGLVAAGTEVVVDHFGDPSRADGYAGPGGRALLRALDTGRVRVKLSAAHRFPLAPGVLAGHAATLLDRAGPERIFFGTDAPFVGAATPTTYAEQVGLFLALVPDPGLRRRMSAAAHAYYFGSS